MALAIKDGCLLVCDITYGRLFVVLRSCSWVNGWGLSLLHGLVGNSLVVRSAFLC